MNFTQQDSGSYQRQPETGGSFGFPGKGKVVQARGISRPGISTGQGYLQARDIYRPLISTGQGYLQARDIYRPGISTGH